MKKTPEYENRASRGFHTKENLDRSSFSPSVIKLVEEIESINPIPPRNGEEYTTRRYVYHLDSGKTLHLNERQMNMAKLSSEGYGKAKYEILVEAGYSPYAVLAKPGNARVPKQIKQELTSKYDLYATEDVKTMTNYLRYNGAVELAIDAQWLLNEQVDLYTECRRKGLYTQAVRLLNDISYHVDVDARVSNKIEITETVDYAAILADADNRQSLSSPEAIETAGGDTIEGEFSVEDSVH